MIEQIGGFQSLRRGWGGRLAMRHMSSSGEHEREANVVS